MKVENTQFFRSFIELADHGDQMGWHERNGGNLTYWIKDEEIASIKNELHVDDWNPLGISVPVFANEYFLITGTGEYFHNMKKLPKETTGIIQIDSTGKFYSVCWGLQRTKKPTSELCTHILCLAVKAEKQYGVDRVVYHCHSQNLIALTFILPLKSEIITKELWQMMSECPIIFPEGVGVVEWMVPGGPAIAKVTSCLMNSYNAVIWAHHGTFCIEDSFDSAFGLMHTLEKSAEIWIKVHSCSDRKRQTITKENFIKLAKNLGVSLNESALKECA